MPRPIPAHQRLFEQLGSSGSPQGRIFFASTDKDDCASNDGRTLLRLQLLKYRRHDDSVPGAMMMLPVALDMGESADRTPTTSCMWLVHTNDEEERSLRHHTSMLLVTFYGLLMIHRSEIFREHLLCQIRLVYP